MPPKPQSMRLTFSYRGTEVRLLSIDRIEAVSLPSDPVRPDVPAVGFWYEVLDAEGTTLYRRVTENPIRFSVQVRSDDPDRPLKQETVQNPQGIFVLQIPYFERAQTLALVSSPFDPARAAEPAKEVARFDLRVSPQRPS